MEETEKQLMKQVRREIIIERDNSNHATQRMLDARKELQEAKNELFFLKAENHRLNHQYSEIDAHYFELYEETQKLSYQLEFKEHEINKLQYKLSLIKVGK